MVAPSIRKRRPIPYSDEQLEGGRGILRVWSGAVTARDVIAANADSFAREDWTKVEYVIADFTGATTVQATADEIRQISFAEVRHAMSFPHLVIAVVAPTDIIFGLARMWQVFAGADIRKRHRRLKASDKPDRKTGSLLSLARWPNAFPHQKRTFAYSAYHTDTYMGGEISPTCDPHC